MASLRRLKISALVTALTLLWVQTIAFAEEKKLIVEFDKSGICCVMNPDGISQSLESVNGINIAAYNSRSRAITLYYDTAEIGVADIVTKVSEITGVEEEFLFTGSGE